MPITVETTPQPCVSGKRWPSRETPLRSGHPREMHKSPNFAEASNLDHPQYRADIDGLRAIAVLSVVGFHAFPFWFKGGFIGVDIFFVISGFLISTIIIGSLERNSFSFVEFYSRRIKRIFPALLLVLIACFAFGWFALLADEYKQLGKHIAGGAGFISNLLFWNERGYFDNVAEKKPLLHLWSLGIEEQFYIIWPLFLWFAWKQRLNLLTIAVAVGVISFVLNIDKVRTDTVAAFYSPQTRFWELMAGSVLAYMTLHKQNIFPKFDHWLDTWLGKKLNAQAPETSGKILRNVQSLLGVALIAIGILVITKARHFPGWWAVLPTLGAVLIISAGAQAWLNRVVLSNRVLVWFGLISFPLYLWHWSLLSFVRIAGSETPSLEVRIATVLISIALAWLTYRLIEIPIRFGKQNRTKTIMLVLFMVVLAGVGYVTYMQDGLRQRVSVQATVEKTDELIYKKHWTKWSLCPNEGESKGCRILDPSRTPDIALIGDSHAGHLASGLAELYSLRSENVVVRLGPGCIPFFEMEVDGQNVFFCEESLINKALEEAITSTSIKSVILSSYAVAMIQGNRGDSPNGLDTNGYVNNASIETVKKNVDVFKKAMNLTLERLVGSGKQVIFIVDTPELYFNPTECVSFRPVVLPGYKLRTSCAIDKKKFEERNADYHRIVAEARAAFPTVKFINAYEYLCDKELCYGLLDGELLYMTRDHLTPAGSRYLVRKMAHELLK